MSDIKVRDLTKESAFKCLHFDDLLTDEQKKEWRYGVSGPRGNAALGGPYALFLNRDEAYEYALYLSEKERRYDQQT